MKRDDFFTLLSEKISPLPAEERNKLYEYYNEIILDKKDAGIDEDTIIASFGDIDEIAARVLSEYPELKAGQQPVHHQQPVMPPNPPSTPKQRSAAVNVLIMIGLILGSPVWLSLILAAAVVLLSVIITIAALVIAFWIMDAAFLLSGFAGCFYAFWIMPQGPAFAFFCMGISLFFIGLGCLCAVGMVKLSVLSVRFIRWMLRTIGALPHRKAFQKGDGIHEKII